MDIAPEVAVATTVKGAVTSVMGAAQIQNLTLQQVQMNLYASHAEVRVIKAQFAQASRHHLIMQRLVTSEQGVLI